MKKSYKIEVDCANCANLIENEISKLDEINSVSVSFMTEKITIDFKDNTDLEKVKAKISKLSKKIEPDSKIYF